MNLPLKIEQIEQILYNRIKDEKFTTLKTIPRPEQFKDIQKATLRIVDAIKSDETINLVGDYDVDGVVSTALMVDFFNSLGVEINYIIPNRFEHGYGLSPKILEQIFDGIVITVDNGISANAAADICKQKGLDLIITDHHTVGEVVPDAYAIINPKQKDCLFPFKEICGAQVAWYLCASIKKALNIEYNLVDLLDLVALAIVADIMPMRGLNKTMVTTGLKMIENSQRPAIKALRERFNLKTINEEDVGFKIAPLINCAGRMSDPLIALEFLLSFDKVEADLGLDYLIELNELRKKEQLQIFEEAKGKVNKADEVIVVASENWNEGIIGIVASKLCEKYKKPSFVLSIDGENAKASCRSIDNIDLYKLIGSCSELLDGFGGHKQAAGLTIQKDKITLFKNMLCKNVDKYKDDTLGTNSSLGDFCISAVDAKIYTLIESYRPYGITNPYPLFTFKNLEVLGVQQIGKNKEYSKLVVSNGVNTIEILVFVDIEKIEQGQKIDCIAQISKNEFRDESTYNLMLKELI